MDELDNRNKELLELCKKQEEKIKELTLKLASAEDDNKISVPSYEQLEGMKRLTRGYLSGNYSAIEQKCDCVKSGELGFYKAINKLGQLEDIEEGLGISLITLFKTFKEGFVDCDNKYHHFTNLYIDDEEIFDGYERQPFKLKDYGITWALTREELENDKRRNSKNTN